MQSVVRQEIIFNGNDRITIEDAAEIVQETVDVLMKN